MDNIHLNITKTVTITSEQYRNLGRKLPKRNVAVPYFEAGISQYSRTVAKANQFTKKDK